MCLLRHLFNTRNTKKIEDSDTFSELKHQHANPVASLDYTYVNQSIIYIYIYITTHEQIALIYKLSRSEAQKIGNIWKRLVIFIRCHQSGHWGNTCKNFRYFGFLAKVPVYLQFLDELWLCLGELSRSVRNVGTGVPQLPQTQNPLSI